MKQFVLYKRILTILLICLTVACGRSAQSGEAMTAAPTAVPTATPEPIEETEIVAEVTAVTDTALPEIPTLPPTPAPTPTPEPTPTPLPLEGFVIGIDPGHQKVYDPAPEPVAPNSYTTKQKVAGGCRGIRSGIYEYDVAQDVGLELKRLLEAEGATVVITHETTEVNISNIERAEIFNKANVDLAIRLHCNQSDDRKMRGAFMLVPGERRTHYYEYNVKAAKTILEEYLAETKLPMRFKEGMTYRDDQTGFNWCTRPIINIEMGHLSNPDEDMLIADADFRKTMARGLFNGFLRFFAENGKPDQ